VRQIGSIEGNKAATDNDWEQVKSGGDAAIQRWIGEQMEGRSCEVVLVGASTANRKWINYEIVRAWNEGLGVVGIRIHGLKNLDGELAERGDNPFDYITYGRPQKPLSQIVKCYEPPGANSKERYAWIAQHLGDAVEEAIRIRENN
jgi:hypothetical protein